MLILGAWYLTVLTVFLVLSCILLVLVVLIQRGRGGGLAGAFGGVGGHSVLGARTGDFLTWVTIACAVIFISLSIGLNLLTPEEPELEEQADANAGGVESVITLSADPVAVEQGKDVTFTFSAPGENRGEVKRVVFVLDVDNDGTGDSTGDVRLGKDNTAFDGWSLTIATGDWPIGETHVVAKIVRWNETPTEWTKTALTVNKAVTAPPPATQPSPTATSGGPTSAPATTTAPAPVQVP